MSIKLKLQTASQYVVVGPFVDSTDGNTELNSLTITPSDVKVWKNNAASFATKNESSNAVSLGSQGAYRVLLDAIDTNTAGSLVIFVHPTGSLPVRVECVVLPANVYEALVTATEWLETTTLRNNVTVSGATITVKKPDGTTTQYTKTGTFTAGADVLTGLD